MRKYKVWVYLVFSVLAAAFSVLSLILIGYWFYQVYNGDSTFTGASGGFILLAYGLFSLVQIVIYAATLLLATSIPRVHKVSRTVFKYWITSAAVTLTIFLVLFSSHTFWEVLLVFYPFLSLITGICALVTVHKSARRLGKRLPDTAK